jgi:hypothetical protein
MRARTISTWARFALAGVALLAPSCRLGGDSSAPEKSPETLAIEERCGDFLDYYGEVIRLSRLHSAQSDSFRAAVDLLPGTHLSDEEWEAWTKPYLDRPGVLGERIAAVLTELGSTR